MSIKKQKKISNRLKKKIFILTFLLASLSISLVAVDVQAIEYSGIYGAADGINNGTKIIAYNGTTGAFVSQRYFDDEIMDIMSETGCLFISYCI